jgi:hypothetical protein
VRTSNPTTTTEPDFCSEDPSGSFVWSGMLSGLAFRHCMEDGNWFQHPESGLSWSNYTTCVDMEDLEVQVEACRFLDTEISCMPWPSHPPPYIPTTFPMFSSLIYPKQEVSSTIMLLIFTRLHDPVIFVCISPDVISLQLCTLKVHGV